MKASSDKEEEFPPFSFDPAKAAAFEEVIIINKEAPTTGEEGSVVCVCGFSVDCGLVNLTQERGGCNGCGSINNLSSQLP